MVTAPAGAPTDSPLQPCSHLIITGASGYIGRRVVQMALASGREVTVLGRLAGVRGVRFAQWQLGEPLPAVELPQGRVALIHLAHDWSDRDTGGINFQGTERLVIAARERGVSRFVFASSQSARRDALNAYGRIKSAIEQLFSDKDTVSARIGLVYGGPRVGLYGLLVKLVSLAPVLPMVEPRRLVQPIHLDEVCRGLLALADGSMSGWVGLAAPDLMSFGEYLRVLAHEGVGVPLAVVPVPLWLALCIAAVSSLIPFAPHVDKERILGLAGTQPLDCQEHLKILGLSVMGLAEGLRRDQLGRKVILREGHLLSYYLLGKSPRGTLIRRYARAVRRVENFGPLALPRIVRLLPATLRVFEPFRRTSPLASRLNMAMSLTELSRDGLSIVDQWLHRGRSKLMLSVFWQVILDAVSLPLRIWFGR
jgi:nucleoside-diphosphate-sugar epimerase